MCLFSETRAYQQCVEYAKENNLNAAVLTELARRRAATDWGLACLRKNHDINVCFCWADTPEGYKFWSNIQGDE